MNYKVLLTKNAEQDILNLYDYISWKDSKQNADYVYEKIKECCINLNYLPSKGHYPPELERIGITAYREIHFKTYRIIFHISEKNVIIHAILDGRRDIKDLLERRLIR